MHGNNSRAKRVIKHSPGIVRFFLDKSPGGGVQLRPIATSLQKVSMKLRLLGLTLMAVAIAYSSLQLLEPEHVHAYGDGCCFASGDCGSGGRCTWCASHCSDVGDNYGFCDAEQCVPQQ